MPLNKETKPGKCRCLLLDGEGVCCWVKPRSVERIPLVFTGILTTPQQPATLATPPSSSTCRPAPASPSSSSSSSICRLMQQLWFYTHVHLSCTISSIKTWYLNSSTCLCHLSSPRSITHHIYKRLWDGHTYQQY